MNENQNITVIDTVTRQYRYDNRRYTAIRLDVTECDRLDDYDDEVEVPVANVTTGDIHGYHDFQRVYLDREKIWCEAFTATDDSDEDEVVWLRLDPQPSDEPPLWEAGTTTAPRPDDYPDDTHGETLWTRDGE